MLGSIPEGENPVFSIIDTAWGNKGTCIGTTITSPIQSPASVYTVDRENFAVKIISWSRPTAKIKHAKNKLHGDDQ